eukprot:NODE_6883_length_810_cov_165.701601_g6647_i0.p1 GENE.NODE_6883_length_810_cov_165.701601_g6647_i0~~NODE_6883_length_810_cov_165.701601_g6647_i0.p1  ORF type:complete len:208 (-),score=36.70 NODE_6883_length_810_cov_165.701601_g6647_i0:149-772(-)
MLRLTRQLAGGHGMAVGHHWGPGPTRRGLPHLLKEVMGAEPVFPHLYKNKTADQILFSTKFGLQLEKELCAIAETAGKASASKVLVPTMLPGDQEPKSAQSIVPKDKYEFARQYVEGQYKKSFVEKPWSHMYSYYCDEDRSRLSNGIGYTGHHGGGQRKWLGYKDFVAQYLYWYIFLFCGISALFMPLIHYWWFGTFLSGAKNRYDN